MAEELLKSRHAFGSSLNAENALKQGLIDEYDILFLDEDTDKPKIGWVSKEGKIVLLTDEKADLTELEADVAELETVVSTKANAEEVDAEISALVSEVATKVGSEEVANAVVEAKAYAETEVDEALEEVNASYEKVKYEVSDVPVGTLVKMSDNEIRILVPENAVFKKQSVGTGGNANMYYMTFRTYIYNNDVVGYREYINEQFDAEVLTDLKVDKYGRKYQPTWLSIASYDESTNTWTYFGAKSQTDKYIGWDYRIDWYNADGIVIASDKIRINLSNENCHYVIEPSYVSKAIDTANAYTDEQIAKIENAYKIVEF